MPTPWENKSIAPGEYTAKLEGFYGKEGKFESELSINITESISVTDLLVSSSFSTGGQLEFSSELQNLGNTRKSLDVYFEIKNFLGIPIFSERSTYEVESASMKEFKAKWGPSFGFGWYTATLAVDNITKTANFAVFVWWQGIIAVIILIGVIYLIIHTKRKYSTMKEKVPEEINEEINKG